MEKGGVGKSADGVATKGRRWHDSGEEAQSGERLIRSRNRPHDSCANLCVSSLKVFAVGIEKCVERLCVPAIRSRRVVSHGSRLAGPPNKVRSSVPKPVRSLLFATPPHPLQRGYLTHELDTGCRCLANQHR